MNREQALRALEKANIVRITRAALKSDIAQGKVDVRDILSGEKEHATLTIQQLLLAAPHFGPRRVEKVCEAAGISPDLTLDKLSDLSRGRLIGAYSASLLRRS